MQRSESIANLTLALAKAQQRIKGAIKDRTNPAFKGSQYADLDSVWSACREPLAMAELAVFQPVETEADRVQVTTILAHSSGEWLSSTLTLTAMQATPQGIGSAITYGRRYGLSAMVGVAPTDDDDGNAASDRGHQEQRPDKTTRAHPLDDLPTDPVSPGDALWKRLLKRDGPEKALDPWRSAAKKALGTNCPPATEWTAEQAHKVELVLFPIEDRGPNP